MSTTPQIEELVLRFYDAFDRRDIAELVSMLADDIHQVNPGFDPLRGLGEVRAFLTGLFGAFPDYRTEVLRSFSSTDTVVVEWHQHATFSGQPWEGMLPSGGAVDLRGASFLTSDGEKISRITGYYDVTDILSGIGALPRRGSRGERLGLAAFRARVRTHNIVRRFTVRARENQTASDSGELT